MSNHLYPLTHTNTNQSLSTYVELIRTYELPTTLVYLPVVLLPRTYRRYVL